MAVQNLSRFPGTTHSASSLRQGNWDLFFFYLFFFFYLVTVPLGFTWFQVIGDENSLNVNFGAGSRRRCRSNLYGASAQLYEAFYFICDCDCIQPTFWRSFYCTVHNNHALPIWLQVQYSRFLLEVTENVHIQSISVACLSHDSWQKNFRGPFFSIMTV